MGSGNKLVYKWFFGNGCLMVEVDYALIADMKIAIKTLGCKSNRYESDRLFVDLAANCEVVEAGSQRDLDFIIVNTCTVTHVADRKSRQAIRSLKKQNPQAKVLVFGCGTNVDKKSYEEMEEIDFIAKDRQEIFDFIKANGKEEMPFLSGLRTRALVKIQDGCNNFCSYCIIPLARGPEFSYPSKKILEEVQQKERLGFKEIVLTGINIGQWREKDMELHDLLKMLIDQTKNVRFRISSIEPKNFSPKFFELFGTGRLCPHMHMSLQSGSDTILKRMRRNYDTAEFLEICEKFYASSKDMALTTDIIVGFPGETEAEFEETLEFVKKARFAKIHVFPYSRRRNTVAYMMPNQIPEKTKKERAEILRKLADELALEYKKSLIGREYEVLVEEVVDGVAKGYTPNYVMVKFEAGDIAPNEFVKIKLEQKHLQS